MNVLDEELIQAHLAVMKRAGVPRMVIDDWAQKVRDGEALEPHHTPVTVGVDSDPGAGARTRAGDPSLPSGT